MLKRFNLQLLVFSLLFVFSAELSAQTILTGTVRDSETNRPLLGVSVFIAELKTGAITDSEGKYKITVPHKKYTVRFSYMSYKSLKKEVNCNKKKVVLNAHLEPSSVQMNEIVVEAKGDRKSIAEAKKQGVPVSIIDGKLLAGRGTSISEVINHQTGVKLRKTGGIGSAPKINIRGLEGNRVQIYLDGIALNTQDGSFSINDIPLQFIDRIEIYKGIVPPEFGGDGLGSAINVVTIDPEYSYFDASYNLQSYGGHSASFLYKHYFPESNMYVAGTVGMEVARNDYTINSPFTEGVRFKRDHDHFRKIYGAFVFDLHKTYFDELVLENIFYTSTKEIQGIQTNIRHAENSGWVVGSMPKLVKKGFLTKNLDMQFAGLILYQTTQLNDTSSYIYDFSGNRSPNTYKGEIGSVPNMSDDKQQDYRYNFNLKYHLLPQLKINMNNNFRFVHNETNDIEADKFLNTNYSGFTTDITNIITSLNLDNRWFNQRLTTLITGRHYYYKMQGKTVDMSYGINAIPSYTDEQRHYTGYSLALKWDFAKSWLLKFAVEHNYRLPRSEELLGDRVRIIPNTQLRPEQAYNYNLGVMYDRYFDNFQRLQVDVNVYSIIVKDMMITRSANYYLAYYNIGKALLSGADAEIKWDINREWFIMLNASYQQSIDKTRHVAGTNTPNLTYDLQMPHIPIFFINWSLDYRKDNFFGGRGQYTRLYYEGSYTDKYNYGYNLTVNQNFVIPETFIHTVGAEYAILDRRILFSFECHNIFNANELTNFNYPLAGRTLQAKVRVTTLK